MANRYFLFFSLIYICHSFDYINICFDVLDGDGEKVNVKVNKKIPFIPEIVAIKTSTLPYYYDQQFKSKGKTSKILRKSDRPCNNPFIFNIHPIYHHSKIVKISLVYEPENYELEVFETVIKSNFEEKKYELKELKGLNENAKMDVVFINNPYFINIAESKKNIDYGLKPLRKLQSDEIYCMSVFTHEFSNLLALRRNYAHGYPIEEYHSLELNFRLSDGKTRSEEHVYLVKLFPCNIPFFQEHRLQILTDHRAIMLLVYLYGRKNKIYFLNEYRIKHGQLILEESTAELDFLDLKIIQITPTQRIVDSREFMLRYPVKKEKIKCPLRLPGISDTFGLSFVETRSYGDIVLSKKGYYPDMTTQESKVFNIIPARPSDEDICVPA